MNESGKGFKIQINQSFKDGILVNVYDDEVSEAVKNFDELKDQLGLKAEPIIEDFEKEEKITSPEQAKEIMEKDICPICGQELRFVPAGVSKRTGKKYDAFYSCSDRKCGYIKNI